MSHKQSTPLEIVELYIRHTSNEGEMTHAEQMDRIRGLITDMWNSPYVQGAWG